MHTTPHTAESKKKMSLALAGKPNLKKRKKPEVVNGVTLWRCPDCKRWLAAKQYYSSKRTPNGLTSDCRNCHIRSSVRTRDTEKARKSNRESTRRMRAANPAKFREKERLASKRRTKDQRYYARQMVYVAVKGGFLTKPSTCSNCGRAVKITAHHPDYSKPLRVVWLCYECHGNK